MATTEKVMNHILLTFRRSELKIKTDGTLDFRYSEAKRIFREEFKRMELDENRRYNKITADIIPINYRKEIIELNEVDMIRLIQDLKIEIKYTPPHELQQDNLVRSV